MKLMPNFTGEFVATLTSKHWFLTSTIIKSFSESFAA
jgi:hypothetical protein